MGFSKTDVGRLLDQHMLERIITLNQSSGLSIGGEGGEYESLVLDAPFFKKKIIVEEATVEWDETKFFGYYRIEKLRTEKKV
jgi:diphthamide synthase (EF-2-diphthine--ammonia ligase)